MNRSTHLAAAALAAIVATACSSSNETTVATTVPTAAECLTAVRFEYRSLSSPRLQACRAAGLDPVWNEHGFGASDADYERWIATAPATQPAGQDWRVDPAAPTSSTDWRVRPGGAAPPLNPGTISKTEFNQIREGMTAVEVRRIIGSTGELISSSELAGTRTEMYMWDGDARCDLGANANVMIQDDVVIAKAQFGLC